MRRVCKNLCPATISASIMAANMWKNSLKNAESDNNKILYKTLLDFFFYSETVLIFRISLVDHILKLKAILFASVGSTFVSLQRTSVTVVVQQRIFPLPSPFSVTVSTGDDPRYDSLVSLVLCTNVY